MIAGHVLRAARSRRAFLRGLVAAPLVPSVVDGTVAAIDVAVPAAAGTVQNQAQVSSTAEADALMVLARARFGQYLQPGDLDDLRRGLERTVRNAAAIAQVKIGNSDEPDFMFVPEDVP